MTLNPAIFRELQDLQRGMTDRLPRYLVKALAAGLYAEGKDFLAAFRQQIRGRFKTGGSKFANTFKTFTAGDRLDNLKLEAFTRLEWAPIYERGGTITPRGSWLIVPVSPRLLTPTGRVKRRYRDQITAIGLNTDYYPGGKSPQELVEILASQLSDGKQAEQFVSSIHLPNVTAGTYSQAQSQSRSRSQGFSGARPISQSHPASAVGNAAAVSGANTPSGDATSLSPDFLQRCQQALVRCIGPMATMLLEDALADYSHLERSDFIAQLAMEIPDPKKAQEFQQLLA